MRNAMATLRNLPATELAALRRRIDGPKMPAAIARLAELPAGTSVVRSGNPSWSRRLDEVYWSKSHNTWLARLDTGTRHAVTCLARELRTAGDQLDLLAPAECGRAIA